MTVLRYKDFRRTLYGEGNYRIFGKYKKYTIKKRAWSKLDTEGRCRKFEEFLKNKKSSPKLSVVKSTYSKFTIPDIKTAKKPGQRTRIKSTKNLKK